MAEQIRVVVVDEEPLMCAVNVAVFNNESDIVVVGSANTADEALDLATACDVMVVSTSLPDLGALRLAQAVTDNELPARVLVVGLGDSEDNILSFIAAGVAGYVLKESSVDEMIEHVRTVAGGSARISPSIARALMDRVADLVRLCDEVGISVGGVANLTPREAEVLELISRGFTNQEIADEMVIELGTVKNHVHNVLRKLNVSNRTDAARYFMLMKGGEAAAAP